MDRFWSALGYNTNENNSNTNSNSNSNSNSGSRARTPRYGQKLETPAKRKARNDGSLISSISAAPSAAPSAAASSSGIFEGSRMPQNRLSFQEPHPNQHLTLQKPKAKSPPKLEQLSRTSSTASNHEDVCAMCLIANNKTSIPVCTRTHKNENVNHMFHEKCICDYVKHTANAKCPECRAELKKDLVTKCKSKKGGQKSIRKRNSQKRRRTNKKR
jgi:hypothetical protein